MTTLLYLESSPRGDDSISTRAAEAYLNALPGSVTVNRLDLFDKDLPEFAGAVASAKYRFMAGADLSGEEQAAWDVVTGLVDEFKAADHYLISAPMWNYGIPYKLKQYIDLITHPGLTFTMSAKGMEGLVKGSAVVVYARGGEYSPKDGKPDPYDHQSPYLKAWLGLVGIGPVEEVAVQKTLAKPEVLEQQLAAARERLAALAAELG